MTTSDSPGRPAIPLRPPSESSFQQVLTRAIHRRGVSLRSLQRRLAASGHALGVSTLSQWQNGHRRPEGAASLAAVEQLELLLDLREGELIAGLGPGRRLPPSVAASPEEFVRSGPDMVTVLAELDFELPMEVAEESIHATVQLDHRMAMSRHGVRTVLRATRDGAQRFPLALQIDDAQSEPIDLRLMAGCAEGRSLSRPDQGSYVWELILERPLLVNETTVVEHELAFSPSRTTTPDRFYEYHVLKRVSEVLVWVRFSPGHVPDTCEVYEQKLEGEESVVRVDLGSLTGVHHRVRNFGPGRIGVRWA